MRLKETKEVVDMIKRIEAGGGGDTHPFPQPPPEPDTVAYIENGTVITINCPALKDLLIAKGVDVTSKFTTPDVSSETGGSIYIGQDPNTYESCVVLESYVDDGKVWIYSYASFAQNDPIEVTTDMSIADVLDTFGTQTLEVVDISGLIDFAFLSVSDLDNGSQELEINADEAASFITVTAP